MRAGQFLDAVTAYFDRQSKAAIFGGSIAFTLAIGYADWVLPYEANMTVFYLLPILFSAWFSSRRDAVVVSAVCTATWYLANRDLPAFQSYTTQGILWISLNRLASFSVVAVGGSALRYQRDTMRARVAALERTRELEEEILRVSERAQMRLGQDLHDGLCQHLAAIDCAVACLKHDLEEQSLPEAESATFIHEQLSKAIGEARDMARGVFPVHIDEEGFYAALQEVVDTTNRLRQINVTLKSEGDIRIKDPQTGMHLFRIAQEALNNVAKHAQATKVTIDVRRTDGHLAMTITDDGIGLKPGRPATNGIGMQTMSYRAKSIGAEIGITPGPNGGTVVRCDVPILDSSLPKYDAQN